MSAAPRTDRLGGVQCLRALAALLVLASHVRFYESEASAAPLAPAWLDGVGGSGVDLFFVISGFVMVYVTRGTFGRPVSPALFLYNRVTRIYPPVWLFTTLVLLGAYAVGTAPYWLENSSVVGSYLLWPTTEPPLHGVTWTLIHEMYFYLVFAVFLLGPARLLPLWLALWAVIVIAGNLAGLGDGDPRAALALHPMTLEFIAGAFAGLLVCSGRRRFGRAALTSGTVLYGLACAAMGAVAMRVEALDWARTLLCAPSAFLLVYGIATLEADTKWRAPRAFIALGDWSYALYLSHPLVLSALSLAWARAEAPASPFDNLAWFIIAPAAAILFAGLAYRFFEQPMLRRTAAGRARFFNRIGRIAP